MAEERRTSTVSPLCVPAPILGTQYHNSGVVAWELVLSSRCLQFPPLYIRWEADMTKEERLYSLARNTGAVGQTRPPCCWSGRWLSYSSLKERELGWCKTLRTSDPRGFEKQKPQEGRCLPRPLELLAPHLVWK